MTVQLSNTVLRRCLTSHYKVQYCNDGNLLANDAFIEIDLGSNIEFIATAFTDFVHDDNYLRFNLGDVDINECGDIWFSVRAACSVDLGETLCMAAIIFPNAPCNPSNLWNGAKIQVEGSCENDELRFSLQNVGAQDMLSTEQFIIIEDDVMRPPVSFSIKSFD